MRYFSVHFIALLLIFTPFAVSAQEEEATLVADVSLDGAVVEQTAPRLFDISFGLLNQMGTQPGVQYALYVIDVETGVIVDGIASKEPFTLYSGERREERETYSAPETLDGDYFLTLDVRTQDGLTLVNTQLDLLTFEGTGNTSPIEGRLLPELDSPIESVVFDKDAYQEGDTASVTVVLTVPEDAVATVSVADGEGEMCGEGSVSVSPDMPLVIVPVSVEQDCTDPVASIVVRNVAGATLDTSEYQAETQPKESNTLMITLVVICVLLALYIGRVIYRHNAEGDKPSLTLSILLTLIAVSFLTFAPQADAATWKKNTGYKQGNTTCFFYLSASTAHSASSLPGIVIVDTSNLPASVFNAGDPLYFRYSGTSNCKAYTPPGAGGENVVQLQNLDQTTTSMTARIDSGSAKSGSIADWSLFKLGGLLFTAPNAAGSHKVNFSAKLSSKQVKNGAKYSISGSVPFTVQDTRPQPSVNLEISADGQNWASATSVDVVARKSFLEQLFSAAVPTAYAGGSVTIEAGSKVYLKWTSENTKSCDGRGFDTYGDTTGSREDTPTQTGNKTYRINCAAQSQGVPDATDSVTANVNPAVVSTPPTVSIRARVKTPTTKAWHTSAFSIEQNENIQINYSSQNAVRCDSEDFNTFGETSGWRGNVSEPAVGNSKTYTVSCVNEDGVWRSDSIQVSTNAATVSTTANISASPRRIEEGESTTVTWGSTNATTCRSTSSPLTTGGDPSGSESITLTRAQVKTFSIECESSGGGTATASTQVTVVAPSDGGPSSPSPTATIEVRNDTQGGSWTSSNITIVPGDQISLRWDSSNANSCNGSSFNTGGADGGTTSNVSEPSGGNRTTYSVTCSGSGGSDSASLRVTSQAVDPELSASTTDVRKGESATINYNMRGNDPALCSLSGPGLSYLAGSFTNQTGSINVTISGDSTFTLTCPGGSDEVTVELIPIFYDS